MVRCIAELKDVFSTIAFSSRMLVNVAVLEKRHQHIKVEPWLVKILFDLTKFLLVPAQPSDEPSRSFKIPSCI